MQAIRAPEYFPDLTFAQILVSVDELVLDSHRQYSRQSHQNRARLRTPDGWQWITVPLVGGQFGKSIRETRIDYTNHWTTKHLKAMRFNYGSTPFYAHYIPRIEALLHSRPTTLGELTSASVRLVHEMLQARARIREADAPMSDLHDPGQAVDLRDEAESIIYRQNFEGYISGMSALDLLFNHGPASGTILRAG